MKKLLESLTASITAITLMFSFSACGKKEDPPTETAKSADYSLELPIYALTEETTEEGTIQYSDFIFDKYGKLLGKRAEGDKSGVYDYIYNENGFLDKETFTNDEGYFSETYFYNDDGTVESKRINSDYSDKNWVTYRYAYQLDDLDRPEEVTITCYHDEWQNTVISYKYDNASRPIEETLQYYKYGVGPNPDKSCVVSNTYDENGNLIRSVSKDKETNEEQISTFKYECIEHRTIYSKTEEHLTSTDTWKYYTEASELPQPDSCSKKLPFSQKSNTADGIAYTYRVLANKDSSTQFEGADRYLLEYKTILTQLCDLTLLTREDNSVQIIKDDQVLATLTTGTDKQNNPLCIITISEQTEEDQD